MPDYSTTVAKKVAEFPEFIREVSKPPSAENIFDFHSSAKAEGYVVINHFVYFWL